MTTINVPHTTLQILFDAVMNSLDFGSGFLDNDDVQALRDCAVLLDVDPVLATPGDFHAAYGITPDQARAAHGLRGTS